MHFKYFLLPLLALSAGLQAGELREVPASSPPRETEIQEFQFSKSDFPRELTLGLRLSAGFFSFTGSEAEYVGQKHPGSVVEFGPVLRYRPSRAVEISPGVAFAYRYHKYNEDDYRVKFEEFLIEIPVVVHFYLCEGFFIGAGAQLSPVLHEKNSSTSYGYDVHFNSYSPEMGGIIDLGYAFRHFSVDARLYSAFTDYSDNDIIGDWKGLTYRPLILSLGVSYLF